MRSVHVVDVEGTIETARQRCDESLVDEWKIEKVISG